MLRNYFADLELPVDATPSDVKSAFRRLARRFHPDLNPHDPQANEAFRKVHEAFEFLSSGARLEKLRQQLAVEISQIRKKPASRVPVIRARQGRISRISKARPKALRAEDSLDLHLIAEVESVLAGSSQMIEFEYLKPCPQCRRPKLQSKQNLKPCGQCSGIGFSMIQRGANHWKKSCDHCQGRGYLVKHCAACHGKSKISENQIVEFKIPGRLHEKDPVCLKGLGNISFDGTKRGDVWVQLEPKK